MAVRLTEYPAAESVGSTSLIEVVIGGNNYKATLQQVIDLLGDIDWDAIQNKPTTFPPDAHNQDISTINGLNDALGNKENTIPYGQNFHYLNGDKEWIDFATSVLESLLEGFDASPNAPVENGDSVLYALGKLQAQLNELNLGTASSFAAATSHGAIGFESDEPDFPDPYDQYILGPSPSGPTWDNFAENDIVVYLNDEWFNYTPMPGWLKIVLNEDKLYVFESGAWKKYDVAANVVTESGSNRDITPDDHNVYIRFDAVGAKTATFDSAETFFANQELRITNRAASDNLTLTPAGTMVLNAPKGGTLVLEPGDTVTIKFISATEADVYGSTEAL